MAIDGTEQKVSTTSFESLDLLIQKWRDGTLREIIDDWKWIFTYSLRYKWAIVFYLILGVFGTTLGLVGSIAGKYLKTVASLESQCDKDVESLLSDLRTELEAQGKDTSIIETLRKAYNEEKSLKKAYYLDVYTNGISKKG